MYTAEHRQRKREYIHVLKRELACHYSSGAFHEKKTGSEKEK
jgi:hypothetical protein